MSETTCSVCGAEFPAPVELHHSDEECEANRRVSELEAQATRVQVRPGGLITDYFGVEPKVRGSIGSAIVVRCVHGTEWPEGGLLEDGSIVTCRECIKATYPVAA